MWVDLTRGFRLRLRGGRGASVPDAIVRHMGSATSGGPVNDFSAYHGHRNLVWTYFKNMPTFFLIAFMPLHVLMNIFTILQYLRIGKLRVILKAKRDAIYGLPRILKQRTKVQETRVVSLHDLWDILSFREFPARYLIRRAWNRRVNSR
jgi:GT2 family glycosyltransferase